MVGGLSFSLSALTRPEERGDELMNEQLSHVVASEQVVWRAARDQQALEAMLGWARSHHSEQPVTCAVALEAAAGVRDWESQDG
jgi:hypothetical protein